MIIITRLDKFFRQNILKIGIFNFFIFYKKNNYDIYLNLIVKIKYMKLDEKDVKIISILARNGREKVTKIAREINLSIDATNKRIKKMVESGVFDFGIYLYPQKIGYNITTNNLVKLHNFSREEYDRFIEYLVKHPRVTTLLTLAGDYDLNIVIMAKNSDELQEIASSIRMKFAKIISDWKTLLVTRVNKFEEYNFFEK